MPKTIFITSFNPFISRNILSTDVLETFLERPDIRAVIFAPDYKVDYFIKNFSRHNIFIEGIKTEEITKQDIILNYFGRSLINTQTLAIHRKRILARNKKLMNFLFSHFLSLIGRFALIKKIIRFFDYWIIPKNKFRYYFEKYRPDLVFVTDMFHNDDIHFLAEAKKRKIFTIGMIRSWDNITNKGLFRVKPLKLIVHNEIVKNSVIKYEDMKAADIFVSGLPQFDCYVRENRSSREVFFKFFNFDPAKRLILVAPHGKRFLDTDWQILEILKQAAEKRQFQKPVQFLVRFPPNDDVSLGDFQPNELFRIERPGIQFQHGVFRDQELDKEDMAHLADLLRHSDVVINYGSTISIDAAAFDKPIILIAFDGREKKSYLESARRFYDYDHVRQLIQTNAGCIVRNSEELIAAVNRYLIHPESERAERAQLVKEQCGTLDGRAGKRIAEFILRFLFAER